MEDKARQGNAKYEWGGVGVRAMQAVSINVTRNKCYMEMVWAQLWPNDHVIPANVAVRLA